MDERNYMDWDNSLPGISFSLKRGRITIFKTTLEIMGFPEFYHFLYNPDTRQLAIEPCKMNDHGAYAMVEVKKDLTYDVSSTDFVRIIYHENGWNGKINYRIAGVAYPQDRAVEFDLTKALEIHEGRVMDQSHS